MSVEPDGLSGGFAPDAPAAAVSHRARVALAEARADARLATAIDDFFLPDDSRLDDRTRAAIAALVSGVVGAVERELLAHAGRVIASQAASLAAGAGVLPRLVESGLLRDATLMAELVGRARQDLLSASLGASAAYADRPSLMARLVDCPDGVVASAANAYLVADSRRRGTPGLRTELPAELHHRIVWWVAAALRERFAPSVPHDRALAEAALRSLAAHDEGDRLEAVAMRLAAAIDARPDELADLLTDALGDGRAALFIAAVAHAAGLDYAEARAIILDPDGDRLWLVLRAHAIDRPTIARIGLALADADRRRDLEAFADSLDAIAAIESTAAADAIAPMRLHPDFRIALRALARSRP